MICRVCGREIANENANFCEYCGASVKDGRVADGYAVPEQGNPPRENADSFRGTADPSRGMPDPFRGRTLDRSGRPGGDLRVSDSEEKEPVIGFGNWMITMLLPFIPMIGPLVYMVMLFVWAFGGTNRTKKNWARAMLIMLIISIIMLMIMFGSVFSELGMQGILGDAVL